VSEFFAMGGYAFYVWGSYGVTALCILLEVYFLNRKAKS
jgi:heme exporter protein D